MKTLLLLVLLFSPSLKHTQVPIFKLSTFNNLPRDFSDCGNYYYLSEKDRKHRQYICVDNFDPQILVSIDNKLVRFKSKSKNDNAYYYKNYSLTIKITYQKQVDDEADDLKAIITIKSGNKIIYYHRVIGGGGC